MLNVEAIHRRARRVLPEVIQTSGVMVEAENDKSLASLLLPLRHKPAGAIAFRLSEVTLCQLRQDPLGYLHAATRARQALLRRGEPFDYRPWRKLKLDESDGYFTQKRDGAASILLLPDARLAIYAWRDRH